MSEKITIQIINEKESIIDSFETIKENVDSYEKLKKLISSKIENKNQKIEYYSVDNIGNKELVKSQEQFINYQKFFSLKVKLISSDNIKNDISLNIFDLNQNIDKEIINNIKDSLKCWICLKETPIEKPFFCPNPKCLKGIHENCLKHKEDRENFIRCICGKIYKIDEFKPNKLINELSEFNIKKTIEYNKKIKNLENKLKEFESLPKRCPNHPNNFLIHYCYDCNKEFCGTCFMTCEKNNHENHRLMDIQVYNDINESIKKNQIQIQDINDIIKKYQNNIDSLEKNKNYFIETLQKMSLNIKIQFDKYIKESNDKIKKINEENKDLINFSERIENLYESLDRKNYNELKNIDELKHKLNLYNIKKNINEKNEMEYINYIEEVNENISKNFQLIIDNQDIFRTKIVIDEDGNKYIGEMKDNIREGKGILYYDNGSKYEGDFKNDKFNGKGVLYSNGKKIYEGEFKDDKREGKGILLYEDSFRYEGEFKNDNFDGKGTIYYGTAIEEGYYKNDKREGVITVYYENGDVSIGNYKDDEKVGSHIVLYSIGLYDVKEF